MIRRGLTVLAYIIGAFVVIFGTFILVALARGYGYDFKTHKIYYNGLVILSSNPSGVAVTLDGKLLKHKTPYRATLKAGTYSFSLHLDGYRDWSKQLLVQASEVTFAEYPLLLPEQLVTQPLTVSSPIVKAVPSRDHHQAAYFTADPNAALWMINLDNHSTAKLYTPKAATDTAPAETLTDVSWSGDGSHLLLQTDIGGKPHYYLMSLTGGQPTDLTNLFQIDLTGLKFNPDNWRELYLANADGLRKIDVNAQTVSAVLADQVASFGFGAGRVLYVQTTPLGKSLWSLSSDGHKQELIQSLAESPSYELQYDNYRGRDLLAVVPSQSHTLTVYTDIFAPTVVSKVISRLANHVLVSPDGRYFEYYSVSQYGYYDVEQDQIITAASPPAAIDTLSIFDGFHVLVASGSRLYLAEYDGANTTQLTDQLAATAFPSNDVHKVFGLRQDPKLGIQWFELDLIKH